MRLLGAGVVTVSIMGVCVAKGRAQTIPLPQIDQVNGSFMFLGTLSDNGGEPPLGGLLYGLDDEEEEHGRDRVWGFGFETIFDIPKSAPEGEALGWRAQVGVGYEHLYLHGRYGLPAGVSSFKGSIRSLPTLTVYVWPGGTAGNGLKGGFYFGAGLSVLQIKDGRMLFNYPDDPPSAPTEDSRQDFVRVSGETFGGTALVGWQWSWGGFIEASYNVRYFNSLSYESTTTDLPPGLSRDLGVSNMMFRAGWSFNFRDPQPPAAPKPTHVVVDSFPAVAVQLPPGTETAGAAGCLIQPSNPGALDVVGVPDRGRSTVLTCGGFAPGSPVTVEVSGKVTPQQHVGTVWADLLLDAGGAICPGIPDGKTYQDGTPLCMAHTSGASVLVPWSVLMKAEGRADDKGVVNVSIRAGRCTGAGDTRCDLGKYIVKIERTAAAPPAPTP